MTITGALFVTFLTISFLIGVIASRSIKGVADYFVAGARMPWYLLTGTFVASNVSAGLFLGATNMTAHHGYAIWCSYFTTSIGFLVGIGFVGVLVRRLATHYEIYDFADILATRYNSRANTIRMLTTSILPIVYIPMLAAQFIALATIASGVLGIPYHGVLSIIALLVVVYTVLGGMTGVVWTDGFQFLVLLIGIIVAVPVAMFAFGTGDPTQGWSEIKALGSENFRWTTSSWPLYLVAGQLTWIFAIPIQPHLVTRFLTARSERDILIALPICLTAGLLIYASTVPLGLIGRVAAPDLPANAYYYVEVAKTLLGPWIGAFALAGIAAAALSTCSTALIVTGQQLSREVYEKWLVPGADEKHSLRAARIAVLLIGILAFVIAYTEWLGIFWLVVLSASLLASIFFVPLVAGFLFSKVGATGAILSMVAGGVAALSVFAINQVFNAHFLINELFAGLTASAIAMWWATARHEPVDTELVVFEKLTTQS